MGVIDASQISYWRRKLFEAEENFTFQINAENCKDFPPYIIAALKKYRLRYVIAKVAASEVEPWLSKGDLVIFKIWPLEYPEVKVFSGNNPDVI